MWKRDNEGDEESAGIAIERQTESTMQAVPGSDMTVGGGAVGMMIGYARELAREPAKMIARATHIGALLGKKGFYRFPMGGKPVEGASIKLAQALVQEWGGVAYQVRVLHVEHIAGGGRRIHLRASVIDLKTLVAAEIDQVATTLAPPGKFALDVEQAERWHSMQTQSAASKVVRNAILRVLPSWLVDAGLRAAIDADAKAALVGKPLPEARAEAVEVFDSSFGITKAELEQYFGLVVELWAVPQISDLMSLSHDFGDGRTTVAAWRSALAATTEKASGGKNAIGIKTSPPATAAAAAKPGTAKSNDAHDAKALEAAKEAGAAVQLLDGTWQIAASKEEAATLREQIAFEKSQDKGRAKVTSSAKQAPMTFTVRGDDRK
jgi:hypothetical protein